MGFNKENSVMVSVIMSVYNAEKYLDLAIESILNQSFRDFEFIIIEDCSTDGSLKILEDYAEKAPRIKLIKKEKNKGFIGFVENLNIGLKEAKGKYIARMDADDIAFPDRLQKQYDFLGKNPNIFLIGTSAELIDENGDKIKNGVFNAETNINTLKNKNLINNNVYHPTIMFRNEQGLFYRDKMQGCEDYDFYLRLYSSGKKISNLPDILLKYRILETSITRSGNSFIKWLFVEKALEFYQERLEKGTDRYDMFSPEDFNCFFKTSPSVNTLILALRAADKTYNYEMLKECYNRLKSIDKNNKELRKYRIKTLSHFIFILCKNLGL